MSETNEFVSEVIFIGPELSGEEGVAQIEAARRARLESIKQQLAQVALELSET